MKTFFQKRWDKYYHQANAKRHWHLIVDGFLSVIILTLLAVNTYLTTNNYYGSVLGTQNNINTANEPNDNQNINGNATSTDEQNVNQPEAQTKSTDLKLQASAIYYTATGEQLGVGPLPPQVGAVTKYWLFINIDGFSHNLVNVLVTANLPENVTWTGKSSLTQGDNLSFDDNSRQIKWLLGELTTNDQKPIGLALEVSLIPTAEQIGLEAQLLNDLKISATDTITGKIIVKNNPILTSDLVGGQLREIN